MSSDSRSETRRLMGRLPGQHSALLTGPFSWLFSSCSSQQYSKDQLLWCVTTQPPRRLDRLVWRHGPFCGCSKKIKLFLPSIWCDSLWRTGVERILKRMARNGESRNQAEGIGRLHVKRQGYHKKGLFCLEHL